MRKLAPTSLDWALQHLCRYSDTDKFPRPVELDVMKRSWESSLKGALGQLDLTQHRWSGDRKMLVPKDEVSFRSAAQLDPIDAALFAALIYELGALMEDHRRPIEEGSVFSYRFSPQDDGTLFGTDQWEAFWSSSITKARENDDGSVLTVDITDFYNQVSHHSIENQMEACGIEAPDIRIIKNLLQATTEAISKGIPVGPHPSHLLAEISLRPVDEFLVQRGFLFCRYVDDIHVFCDTREDAQIVLFALAEVLDEFHKLTLNRSKTRIVSSRSFQAYAREMARDQPIDSHEASILEVIKKYSKGPYVEIPVSRLSPEDLGKLSQNALEGIFGKISDGIGP